MAAFTGVQVKKDAWGTRVVVGAIIYPLFISVGVSVLLPEWRLACPTLFVTSAIPALFDAYMKCFSRTLKRAMEDLGLKVKSRDSWRSEDVSGVSHRWVALTQLLQKHNEVSAALTGLY